MALGVVLDLMRRAPLISRIYTASLLNNGSRRASEDFQNWRYS